MGYAEQLAFSLFGACMQELVHWYQLRTDLDQSKYQTLLKSKSYWVITALMILLGPVGVIVWFYGNAAPLTARDYALFGAAFPMIFKAGVGALTDAKEKVTLGRGVGDAFSTYLLRGNRLR